MTTTQHNGPDGPGGVADGRGLTGTATTANVLELLDTVTAADDDIAAVGEAGALAIRHGSPDVQHQWLAVDGELAAYAQLDATGSAELCVAPDRRRQGLGRRLLTAVLADEPEVQLWAHGDLPAARALAESAGLRVTRELWQMRVDLAPGSPAPSSGTPAPPPGIEVRTFVVGQDEEAWVRLNASAFAAHPEQGRLTVQDMRERQAEAWFDPSLLWLAHDAADPGRLLASMWVKVLPHEVSGEIYALGVDPAAQGRGLGAHLTELALTEMVRRGLHHVDLYVEGDNDAAIRTYRRTGFVRSAVDVQYSS